jgi:hypothetical protein
VFECSVVFFVMSKRVSGLVGVSVAVCVWLCSLCVGGAPVFGGVWGGGVGGGGGGGGDILKAFDEAIKDRVNVISVSLGFAGESPRFHSDNIAVGAFSAVRKGSSPCTATCYA